MSNLVPKPMPYVSSEFADVVSTLKATPAIRWALLMLELAHHTQG
jgi:hypothetical protein